MLSIFTFHRKDAVSASTKFGTFLPSISILISNSLFTSLGFAILAAHFLALLAFCLIQFGASSSFRSFLSIYDRSCSVFPSWSAIQLLAFHLILYFLIIELLAYFRTPVLVSSCFMLLLVFIANISFQFLKFAHCGSVQDWIFIETIFFCGSLKPIQVLILFLRTIVCFFPFLLLKIYSYSLATIFLVGN